MDEYVIAPPRKESLPDYNDDIEPVLDPELWNSITQFGYLENPKQVIYIANHLATQPSKQSYLEANDLASFLKYLNVGGILNTSISRVPTDQILDFYENNDFSQGRIPPRKTNFLASRMQFFSRIVFSLVIFSSFFYNF